MFKLLSIFTLLLFASCSCKYANRILEKHPECQSTKIVYKDTAIYLPGKEIKGSVQLVADSSAIDSLTTLLSDCGENASELALIIANYIPEAVTTAKTVHIDDSTFSGSIWVRNGRIYYDIQTKPQTKSIQIPVSQKTLTPVGLDSDKKKIKELQRKLNRATAALALLVAFGLYLFFNLLHERHSYRK
jgi:hypothetical protein